MGGYAILLGLAIWLLSLDFRPVPIYEVLDHQPVDGEIAARWAIGEPFEMRFEAPADGLRRIYWPNFLYHESQVVRMRVWNESRTRDGKPIKVADSVLNAEEFHGYFSGLVRKGDTIRVQMAWDRGIPPRIRADARVQDDDPFKPAYRIGRSADGELPDRDFGKLKDALKIDRLNEAERHTFIANKADFDRFAIYGIEVPVGAILRVELRNLTRDGKLLRKFLCKGNKDVESREFTPDNAVGDRLALDLTWVGSPTPSLQSATSKPRIPLEVTIGNLPVEDFSPAFLLEYDWPSWHAVWLWIPLLIWLGVILWRRKGPREEIFYLVCLGLVSAITSMIAWQQLYAHMSFHIDPDRFGHYGEELARWLTEPGERRSLEAWFHSHRYTQLPLTPLLLGLGRLIGLPLIHTYLFVVGLASFGSLLLMRRWLVDTFSLDRVAVLLSLTLFAGHHMFLRAFAKPSSDPVALLLVIWMLVLLTERLRNSPSLSQSIQLGVCALLTVLARPPGPAFAVFLVIAAVLCDQWRLHQQMLSWRSGLASRLRDLAIIGVIPALISIGLYVGMDWFYNFERARASNEGVMYSNGRKFLITMISVIQWLPILWIIGGKGIRRFLPETVLLVAWTAFYLLLLIGLQGAFVHRLFLPIYPALIVITALSFNHLLECRRWWAAVVLAIAICLNVAVLIYCSGLDYLPPRWLAELVY